MLAIRVHKPQSSRRNSQVLLLQAKMPADGDRGTQVKHVMQVKPFWEGTALQQQLELLSLDVRLLRTQAAGSTWRRQSYHIHCKSALSIGVATLCEAGYERHPYWHGTHLAEVETYKQTQHEVERTKPWNVDRKTAVINLVLAELLRSLRLSCQLCKQFGVYFSRMPAPHPVVHAVRTSALPCWTLSSWEGCKS